MFLKRLLAVSAVVPALVLSTGSAAVAASNTLTLTVLNRSGVKVSIAAKAVNLDTNFDYTVHSGKAKKLPKGKYVVLTSVSGGGTTTLGGKAVKVSGSVALTVDARKGKRAGVAVSPAPAGLTRNLDVRVCNKGDVTYNVEAYGDNVYVIPTTSTKVAFAALGSWTDSLGTSDAYAVVNQTTGVPSNPVRTFGRSSLATVAVVARRGPAGSNSADVAVQPIKRGCADDMFANMWSTDQPTSTKLLLTAGSWDIRADTFAASKTGQTWDIGGYFVPRKVAAGKSYSVRYYNAGWGPSTRLPITGSGHVWFSLNDMFVDPYYTASFSSFEGGDKATATLKYKGKVVKTKKDHGWEPEATFLDYKVKKAGWYTLTNTASRYYPEITYPSGMLSTASSVTYRFYTKPKSDVLAQVNSIRLIPYGLNSWNRAKPGTVTNVGLKLDRLNETVDIKRGPNPKLKSLTAKISNNGGKTWTTVPVKKINGAWVAVVPNPASGAVSLRARATYTSGGYTEVSIYRAYAIG